MSFGGLRELTINALPNIRQAQVPGAMSGGTQSHQKTASHC